MSFTKSIEIVKRYVDAVHRVQTAIAYLMRADPDYTAIQPKHMRVGIDMSKSDQGGLAKLLIDKKIFTEDEYQLALTEAAEREADNYQRELQNFVGNKNLKLM